MRYLFAFPSSQRAVLNRRPPLPFFTQDSPLDQWSSANRHQWTPLETLRCVVPGYHFHVRVRISWVKCITHWNPPFFRTALPSQWKVRLPMTQAGEAVCWGSVQLLCSMCVIEGPWSKHPPPIIAVAMSGGGNWNYCSLVLRVCPVSLGKRGLVTSTFPVFCSF